MNDKLIIKSQSLLQQYPNPPLPLSDQIRYTHWGARIHL